MSMENSLLVSAISATSVCSSELYGWEFIPIDYEQRQQVIDSNWEGYALDLDLWKTTKSPITQVRSSEISLDNKEYCSFLSDRLIGIGLSFLTRSPENGLYILGKCVMRNKGLTNIIMLQYHHYLQYIDIAYNNISCLSFLNSLPYLMYLNASHNKIKDSLNFTPPWYLTYVNLSYNNMTDIGDLKYCWSIVRLNLSHNIIENILGLEHLKYLKYLNLSYNLIECIENLNNLNIQELNLEGNCIMSFKSAIPGCGINILPNLRTIILGYNRLSTLEFFKDAYSLRFIDLKFNKITDLLEVLNLKGLIYEVDFRGNTCTKWPNYRNVLIYSIPSVKFIDGIEVFAAEKVTSATLFASPLDLTAARNVAKLTLLEQLNISKIDPHIQPYDEMSPPLIILTGPSAVKKMALALHVTRTIPNKIKYCRWHTTKEICEDDNEYNAYILINREEFNDIARRGEFLVILDLLGHSYGFHASQITSLISENKIGLTQMNLYATVEIFKRYPNVKTILMLTQCIDLHRTWIREKFDIYTWIRDSIENLLVVKIGKHDEDKNVETANCILNFIKEILEEIVEHMKLPNYNTFVKPQRPSTTATNIILESKTMLPKVIIKRNKVISDAKKCITFQEKENKDHIMRSFDQLLSEEQYAVEELKVILDEDSNIIIDDEKTKREIHRMKMLYRRNTLQLNARDNFNNDDFNESISTDDGIETKITNEENAETLKNIYIELVIKTRKLYLDYHENHPGFFILVLFMDDYIKAFELLMRFIDDLHISRSYQKPIFFSEINNFIQAILPVALENIIDEM